MESPKETPQPPKVHKTFSLFGHGEIAFHDDGDSDSDDSSTRSSVRDLVKPFVIRQWIYNGRIYREKKERVPSRFELFFDLVFVAIAHQLSDAAAEHAGGAGLAQFVLTFFPTWSLWGEFRAFVNTSGTDDILQRLGMLYMMALLIGYTANASVIELGRSSESSGSESTAAATAEHIVRALASTILAAEGGAAEAAAEPGSSRYPRSPALVTATVFFLLGKALRIGFLMMYAATLPRFRRALNFAILHQLLGFVIYFPILFVRSTPAIITLASLGMAFDILTRYTVGLSQTVLGHRYDWTKKKPASEGEVENNAPEAEPSEVTTTKKANMNGLSGVKYKDSCQEACAYEKNNKSMGNYIPALNIEHYIERTAAFVVIVLGEMVLSVVYQATGSLVGFKSIYGNAICGLMIAFNICWLYFDAECSLRFLHALRRHWFTSLTFTNLHFPLCASLILVSAAMSRMTQHPNEMNDALRWYFGGGLGCALICLAGIGATHRGLDPTGTTKLGRHVQLVFRAAVGIIFICLPLTNLNPLSTMGVAAGLTSFLVIEETYGKLRRGEPLAKLSAREAEAAEAHRQNEMRGRRQEDREVDGVLVKEGDIDSTASGREKED